MISDRTRLTMLNGSRRQVKRLAIGLSTHVDLSKMLEGKTPIFCWRDVVKTDKCMDLFQILGRRPPRLPPSKKSLGLWRYLVVARTIDALISKSSFIEGRRMEGSNSSRK